ncbi:MAG: hypothetical protein R2844_22130 [Caldilineales bacterium]
MTDTYTFTARSADEPRHVTTFTLIGHEMAVDPGEPLVDAGLLHNAGDNGSNGHGFNFNIATDDALSQDLQSWLQPVASWLVQRAAQPFNISDVNAQASRNGLDVRAWVRTGGRRLVPMFFRWNEVDNPEATSAFVNEIQRRKSEGAQIDRYPGPLDYWATWLAVAAAAAGISLLLATRYLVKSADESEISEIEVAGDQAEGTPS